MTYTYLVPHANTNYSSNCSSSQRSAPFTGRASLKRQALSHTTSDHSTWTTYTQGPMPCLAPEHRPLKQLKRASPKRVPALAKSTSHLMDIEFDTPTPSSSLHTSTTMDLRSCHICHKAPTRKKDLENYHECERCKEQTCFICARQCANGYREKICRRCCVEVGEEGDTLCLGCYATNVDS